jgi:hypothetical protein
MAEYRNAQKPPIAGIPNDANFAILKIKFDDFDAIFDVFIKFFFNLGSLKARKIFD